MHSFSRQIAKRKSDRFRIALKRSWKPGGTHRDPVQFQELDADTLRFRAREDRRGEFYATVRKKTELGFVNFTVFWSISGRVDQVDVFEAGKLILTVRPSLLFRKIDELVGNCGENREEFA